MSANRTPEQAQAELEAAMAAPDRNQALGLLAATRIAEALAQGMCMGTKAPEPRFTQAEQIDRICQRVAARRATSTPKGHAA